MKKKSHFISFKQLKEQVGIEQILEHYDLLPNMEKKGDSLHGNYCPICETEAEDIFRASVSKNCWNCFGDCSGGNILDFVQQMEECTIREAGIKIASWFSIDCTSKKKTASRKKPRKPPKQPEPTQEKKRELIKGNTPLGFKLELDNSHAWLDELCLSPETIKEFGIGYCSSGSLKGHIAFPIHNISGEIVAYGGIPETTENLESPDYKYPSKDKFNPSLGIFGLYHALQRGRTDVIYLVKSPLDVFQAWHNDEISAVCFLEKPSAHCLEVSSNDYGMIV